MSKLTIDKSAIQEIGMQFAVRYLERECINILERSWRCNAGEADLIVKEDGDLVFIEVKTRSDFNAGFPEETVTAKKRRRYETIAAHYLSQTDPPSMRVRFDVISILITGDGRAFLKHHRDVFAVGE